jgi:ABC-type sugar transport system ATPase subunit
MDGCILEVDNVSKSFGGVHALKNVNFTLRQGEIHSLVGENGAGKSTLMKIISGALREYTGSVKLNGETVRFADPLDAQRHKIATIYQERSLMPELDGAQNIMIGIEPAKKWGAINKSALRKEARKYIDLVSQNLDLNIKVRRMSAAKQQLIEIAKALSRDPDIIIMDEPTSSLTESETGYLINAIQSLKKNGKSVIFISHKMDDIFNVSDRITILRDGLVVDTQDVSGITEGELISKMVGRRIENIFDHSELTIGEEVLRIEGLCRKNKFYDISLSVHAGEIIGLSGLVGAGRSEVALSIFGADKIDSGKIFVRRREVVINSPIDAISLGLALLPEDRKHQGLVQLLSVRENVTLAALKKLCNTGWINKRKQITTTNSYVEKLSIKTSNIKQKISSLSGGNQQKVVLGKWLATKPLVLILDEPTRGIDIGTKAEIYKLIIQLAKEGLGIILISSEMPEILGMSVRIFVMREGKVVANMAKEEATEEKILGYYLGGKVNG